MSPPVIALVALAALFAFLNGAKDGANALATIITSRSMSPSWAVGMVTVAELLGPVVFGVAVGKTIGSNVADPQAITGTVVLATLVSATLWNVLTWWLGIPTSSSHALIGGLVGAVLAANQLDVGVLRIRGLATVGIGLFLAPLIGLLVAYGFMSAARFLLRSAPPRVNWFFKRGQVLTTFGLAVSHGANDSPKAMGLIAMGLLALGVVSSFQIPFWVFWLAAGAVALGTLAGGWRMVRTIGTRFYRVRPIHAFNSQTASGLVVLIASLAGSPVSTSQVVSSSIVGVGAAERLTKVRWGVLREIVMGWFFTIPATALAAAVTYLVLSQWLGR